MYKKSRINNIFALCHQSHKLVNVSIDITVIRCIIIYRRIINRSLYTLQRRRERYIIIYTWKITKYMVPNIDGTIGHTMKTQNIQNMKRMQCVIQYPTNRNQAPSLQENAITVFGPRLYNWLPKYLRDIESFKT